MAKGREFTQDQVLQAIKGSGGIVSAVGSKLGCAWHTADKYINKWETTRRAMADEGEKVLDLAENKLIEAIQNGEQWAIQTLLKTKGKKRGYTERQEFTGADGEQLKVSFIAPERFDTTEEWEEYANGSD